MGRCCCSTISDAFTEGQLLEDDESQTLPNHLGEFGILGWERMTPNFT